MPTQKKKKNIPVINVDEDPQNRDWIRILAKKREAKETPTPIENLRSLLEAKKQQGTDA